MKTRLLIVILMGFSLALGACHKKPRVATAPAAPPPAPTPAPPPDPKPLPPLEPNAPPVDYFQQGEEYFESGDYARAVEAYEKFLTGNTVDKNQDRALFHLAISYALPGTPPHDIQKGMTVLKQLVTLFPESPLKPQAQFVLDLQGEIEKLRTDGKEKEERIKDRNERIREQDERIKRLTSELEKLKKIDMERRPSRPPQ